MPRTAPSDSLQHIKEYVDHVPDSMRMNNHPDEEGAYTLSIQLSAQSRFLSKVKRWMELEVFKEKNQAKFDLLTLREKEIIRHICDGLNNPEIATVLFISRSTVEQHRKNLNRKLRPKSLMELVDYARAYDLV